MQSLNSRADIMLRQLDGFKSSYYKETPRHDSYRCDSSPLLAATVSLGAIATGQVTLPSGEEGDCRSGCFESHQPAEDTAGESFCDRNSNLGKRLGSPLRSGAASDSR